MWVFTNTAFISAVAHRDNPGLLMVRARLKGDLNIFFDGQIALPSIFETPDADYRFRTTVSRETFRLALDRAAEAVDYPNFKSSISRDQSIRHDAYLDVWSAMYAVQGRTAA